MAEYYKRADENGTINIAEDVVAAIAADAVREVEGVAAMSQNVVEQFTEKKAVRGVRVDRVEGEAEAVAIDLYLMARYGYAIPEIAQSAQENVFSAVSALTGFSVKEVNVHVGGISFN